ncbi:MAG TPA: ubiquitin-like protein Pup [Methylomirabilota bacterium]|nr:ubiquitin-like protein Pup [Methylomirabilota bacterium]
MSEEMKRAARPSKSLEREDAPGNPALVKKGEKIKEDLDNLLDEIDDLLEENAEEFVRSYVQRGGQ